MECLERVATFVCWPVNCRHSLIRLANAGFRYSGVADELLCDSCGWIIRDWTQHEESDPIGQHARLSPRCPFLPPLNSVTPTGEPFQTVTAADSPSLRRRSPTARPSTLPTDLPLTVPADTGMASRDPETGAMNRVSLLASRIASGDGNTFYQPTAVKTDRACETSTDQVKGPRPHEYSRPPVLVVCNVSVE